MPSQAGPPRGLRADRPADFVSAARRNVLLHGDERGFTFVREQRARTGPAAGAVAGPVWGRGYREETLGFAEMDRRARGLARLLEGRGLRDRAVLLLYPEGLEFLTGFYGCLYARAIAVPAPLPALDAERFGRTRRIIDDADITWILTDTAHRPALEEWLAEDGLDGRVRCLDTETESGDPDAWTAPEMGPDTLAFLQYTSGSTGEPKGVMVSHGNLLHNGEEIKRRIGGSGETVGVGWVPHYHDMGLVGQFLEPLYLGCRYVFTSPITFIKRPALWLEMITRHRGTITLSPNFGYDLVLRRVKDEQLDGLDLTSLRTVKNGAEPVRAATLESWNERFAPVGFRPEMWMPCYGMAETTLLITAAPLGTGPVIRGFDAEALAQEKAVLAPGGAARRLVGCGRPVTLDVRVVDPAGGVPVEDEGVGEIWVRGGSVAAGYWKKADETRETFGAFTADGDGPFLRTGDLGFTCDGELFIAGRIKDLIIVNGRNIHAQDIEEAARAVHPAAGAAAAFAVDAGTEHVVLVQEVSTRLARGTALDELAMLIKARVARTFELPALSVVLCGRGSVRRTTSGKTQRRHTRQDFLDGRITELAGHVESGVAALRDTAAEATGTGGAERADVDSAPEE
ncbi:fatty acyl-AMP ligase [Actinomadura graeca]|uniref:Fatty acyl-AMP ligase n=1 Tax=Actinomadura graeca TaxID=2750812 RepID=A0ABX8R091_9ACTN|nr:fatty acyl-AMP ligase [Actinomadura graeca]QXJ24313.1 fatty acyl-AMP ligase [Actinomadura graeca]